MRYGSFRDRAKGWFITHKALLLRLATVVGISAAVSAIMILGLAVSPGTHATGILRGDQQISRLEAEIGDLGSILNTLYQDLRDAEDTLAENAQDIAKLEAEIAQLKEESPQGQNATEAWLTGIAGNYTLHARGKPGAYTATVVLCYEPVAINATSYADAMDAFVAGIDSGGKHYDPTLSHNGTSWVITSISLNIGTFTIEADKVREVEVLYSSLPQPDYTYVQIYPALR